MEKSYSLSEAKIKLNRLIEEVQTKDNEFVITKNGEPAAAIVPVALYEGWKETQAIRADRDFIQEIKAGLTRLSKKTKRYSFKDVFGESL